MKEYIVLKPSEMMIWTEEENDIRGLENMINRKGKSCGNCNWGACGDSEFVTCGHHLQNFTKTSFCDYWTDPSDPKLIAHNNKVRDELRKKYMNKLMK